MAETGGLSLALGVDERAYHPSTGDLMSVAGGVRKLRWALGRSGEPRGWARSVVFGVDGAGHRREGVCAGSSLRRCVTRAASSGATPLYPVGAPAVYRFSAIAICSLGQ